MLPYRDSKLVRIFLIIFFLVIVAYAYFEARGILFGPTIQIADTVEEVSQPYVEIAGTTSHIAALSVNGQIVPVTEAGGFDIPFALSPGYNRIVLDATDKYGHATQKVLQIIYTVPLASVLNASTTSTQDLAPIMIATSTQKSATSTPVTGSTSSLKAASSTGR